MSGNDHILPPDAGFYSDFASLPGISVNPAKSDGNNGNDNSGNKK